MYKLILNLFLTGALLFTQLYNAFVAGYYQLNYDYYIENCENKDQPELHCNGKCILAEQFASEASSTDTPEPPLTEISIRLFKQIPVELRLQHILDTKNYFMLFKSQLPEQPFLNFPVPPPRAVLLA